MSLAHPIPRGFRQADVLLTAGQTAIQVPFRLVDAADLAAYRKAAADTVYSRLIYGTDFTLSGVPGSSVVLTLTVAGVDGDVVRVRGARLPERVTSLAPSGSAYRPSLESELDAFTMVEQELRRDVDYLLTAVLPGIAEVPIPLRATQAQAEAGTDNETFMTPLRTRQAIAQALTLDLTRADIAARTIPINAFFVTGETAPGDQGAGALYIRGTAGGLRPIQDAAGTWWNLTLPDGFARPEWFGAKADGTTNCYAAIKEALAACSVVRFSAGTYIIDGIGGVTIAGTKKIIGLGPNVTLLSTTSNSQNVITVSSGGDILIDGFTITRVPTNPTVAAHGIDARALIGTSTFRNLFITRHYNGIALGPTDKSTFETSIIQANSNHGVLLTNALTSGPAQWYCREILSQGNGGDGFVMVAAAGRGSMSVGKFVECYTFANTGRGFRAIGVSAADNINSIRCADCFFGEDGQGEVYLDTYGTAHEFSSVYMEITGSRTTGPGIYSGGGTAASNVGYGAYFTTNNQGIALNACSIVGNSYCGVTSLAADLMITNCFVYNNGRVKAPSLDFGVEVQAGNVVINACRIGNKLGANFQKYGVVLSITKAIITSNDLRNNTDGAIFGAPEISANNLLS